MIFLSFPYLIHLLYQFERIGARPKTHKNNFLFSNENIKSNESKKYVILNTNKEFQGAKQMQNILFWVILSLILILGVFVTITLFRVSTHIQNINKTLEYQYNLIVKMQSLLKTKSATNAVAENAEMIYQDLLQNLIPVMATIGIMPRNTTEHPLWRALGGIMDEYAKNPFALEKLRRAIKLDTDVARNIENYISRADRLLRHLNATEPDGILASTFTDGLLGQSLAFFTQAQTLANQEHNE